MAAIPELARQIASEGQHGLLASKAVFFDVLGYFMARPCPCLCVSPHCLQHSSPARAAHTELWAR